MVVDMMTTSSPLNATFEPIQVKNKDWRMSSDIRNDYPSDIFAQNVFTLNTLCQTLPKTVYTRFIQQLQGRELLDKATSDAVAHAVRTWAMDRGATHFTHWFQPQTGTTAEKHDSFLSMKSQLVNGIQQNTAIDVFSGSQLVQAEPDASSFPNGGIRSTFEARGYTIWDTTSPMFLRKFSGTGACVLYIPSCFISYNGEALDEKTILLRSSEVLSEAATKMLNILGDKETKRVYSTLGTEQEFFLVDSDLVAKRPDLMMTGRSLIGNAPPKHQQLEDHYFGKMPNRILAIIAETEVELYKLGVPVKTRHNEVAPHQFEMAPIFEEAIIAVDHNLLLMDVLQEVAHKHNMTVLYHEKPFKGMNGSGKHCNWSLSTDSGDNLLDPTSKPETNLRFLLCLVAVLDAVMKHSGLLRASIASSSNEHRLGANEAPPGILSAFLGSHLTEVLNAVEENRDLLKDISPDLKTIKLGGTALDIKVSTLPPISRDLTDRNRTSPFAFTGNKFEFRAVGANQSPSFPICVLNTIVAASMNAISDDLKKAVNPNGELTPEAIKTVIRKYIMSSKSVRFEGNNYSDEWVDEAHKRGLLNIKSCPTAFKQILEPVNANLMKSMGILSDAELHSRFHIQMEKYVKDVVIEANTLKNMIYQGVLPAAFAYSKDLLESVTARKTLGMDVSKTAEVKIINFLTEQASDLNNLTEEMVKLIEHIESMEAVEKQAEMTNTMLTVAMENVRAKADAIEAKTSESFWMFPKYMNLLF